MKSKILLLLTVLFCGWTFNSTAQVQPLGTVIGNQTVAAIPIAPPGYPMAQALVYYPDDYFLPANAGKRYPLYVFLHGAGEGTTNNITQVINTSLPNLISKGLKPYGIDPVTKDTIKFIVVSPHAALSGSSFSYPQLQYTIPYLFTAFRVDTSCVWVGGLSAGGRGTWSVVMGNNVGDTALGKRITGIMPMANGGYDNYISTMKPNLDTIARRGLGCLYTIGDQDPGYNQIAFFAYQAVMKQFSQPGRYFDSVVIGGTHSTNVWNPPFPETARVWSKTMNSWTQMWTMRKNATSVTTAPPPVQPAPVPPTVSAGTDQTITLPASLTLTGTATPAAGTTISSYRWSQTGGPNTAGISSAGAATTTVTGLVAGVYTFKLLVTASNGATAASAVQITVNAAIPANVSPVANAGTAQSVTLPVSTAALTGGGSDADGTIAGYLWSQVSGPNTAGITAAASASTTVTGLAQGSYVFRLTVTDNQGAKGSADVNVTVNAAPAPAPAPAPTPAPTSTGNVVVKVACTEYKSAYLYSDSVARSFVYNTATGHVEFMPFLLNGRKAVDISTGFNVITMLDDQGYVWLSDKGKNTATRWNTDASGAAFDGNIAIYGYFFTYLSIRKDGSIWYWGGDDYKFYGRTLDAPVKLHAPAGVKFTKIATGDALMALSTTGDVYYWYKGDSNYIKIPLPKPASDIAASHMGFYLAIVPDDITVSRMGWPYVWGPESKYWGSQTSVAPTAPVSIKALWNMSYPIRVIEANQNTIHYIDSQGDMYGLGDNANGEVGNGEELVNHTEKYATPYAWNWGKYGLMIGTPVHILPGTKFKKLYSGNSFVFYNYASDQNDSLYFWGRNKSFVGGDGVVNNQEGTWPNALDVLKPSLRTPLAITPLQTTAYNFTPYALKTAPKQTVTANSAALSATATASVLTCSGKANYGYAITKYQWKQESGPSTAAIASPGVLSTTATGLTAGTYVFSIQSTDNNTSTITAYDTIVVNTNIVATPAPAAPAPAPAATLTVNAGDDQTIVWPGRATLTGKATANDSSVISYKWTQVSGPAILYFLNSNEAATQAVGLVAGTYVLQLAATGSTGLTAADRMTVTVLAATASTSTTTAVTLTVNAGSDQTVLLPNRANLAGQGSSTNSTITSYKWTQVSGPAVAFFMNSNAAGTQAVGLVTGTYVFRLTVTGSTGLTASDDLTVTTMTATTGTVAGSVTSSATALSTGDASTFQGGSLSTGTMRLYPNPALADQQVTIEGAGDKAGVVKISIYDLGGRMIKQVVREDQSSVSRQTIPLTGIARGAYIVSVQSGGKEKPDVFRLVIQ